MQIHHQPVFLDTLLRDLIRKEDTVVLDATLGEGGHTEAFLQRGLRVIGLERDPALLKKAISRLGDGEYFIPHRINFKDADEILIPWKGQVDLALFDLGISTFHYAESKRGFSFKRDEPLDMRLEPGIAVSAERIVNTWNEKAMADLFFHYGGEKKSRPIARAIVRVREKTRITTTSRLAALTLRFYPRRHPIHPATRIFQALRIQVNDELAAIEAGLLAAAGSLAQGGRLAVIAYHSLEDKIAKETFRNLEGEKKKINKYRENSPVTKYRRWNKKPIMPSLDEIRLYPSSRSAKMRILLKEEGG